MNRFRIDNFKTMEAIVEIGLSSFIRLRKLRVEHLSITSTDHEAIFSRFLEQLSENQTISLIKMERVFTTDGHQKQRLHEAIH